MKQTNAILLLAFLVGLTARAENADVAAPCSSLPHTDGVARNICDKDSKPFLILEFFSTRCGHCRRNVPLFKRLEAAVGNQAHSRLVSLNSAEDALRFSREYGIATQIAVDAGQALSRSFGVRSVPSIFVLDANNQIVHSRLGILNDAAIEAIKKVVNGEAKK